MVPVVDLNNVPLMPCMEKRARLLMERGQAKPFWKVGIFCIQLTKEPSARNYQDISVGIDPGSKREGFTAKTAKKTIVNLLVDAVTWVKRHMTIRKILRRNRRNRNTPCREPRFDNRVRTQSLAPSTKARWDLKRRVLVILARVLPITYVVVEDIKAKTRKNGKHWNLNFSPVEVGKRWFYAAVEATGFKLHVKSGFETKVLRDVLGLKKIKSKLAETFSAHNVDSWILADMPFGSTHLPETAHIHRLIPLRYHRRALHEMCPAKGGVRVLCGGTRSMDLRRGTLVQHPVRGLCYVGGTSRNNLSLHDLKTGARITQNAKRSDLHVLNYNSWRFYQVSLTSPEIK